jgi:hypothetical protein
MSKQEFHFHFPGPDPRIDTVVSMLETLLGSSDPRLDTVMSMLSALITQGAEMATDFTAMTTAISANTDAQQSAIQLIQELAGEIRAAAGDQDAVNAFAAQLQEQAAALAAAVVANTPVGPEPPTP